MNRMLQCSRMKCFLSRSISAEGAALQASVETIDYACSAIPIGGEYWLNFPDGQNLDEI